MSWKDDIVDKLKEKNPKEGETYDRISSRTSNRNNTRSSNSTRNTIPTKNRKDITNDKREEEKLMITREAALSDLAGYEKEATDGVSKTIIKVGVVLVKMLATIRSNQLLTDDDKRAIKAAREARKAKEPTQ